MSCEMPPKERTIIHPETGFQERAYYIVEASFSPTNPIHRYIWFSGFLNNGNPSSYNQFFNYDDHLEIGHCHYFKTVEQIAYAHVHNGATAGFRPWHENS